MKKVNVISLGCSKNLVDTELLMRQLEKAGYAVELDGDKIKDTSALDELVKGTFSGLVSTTTTRGAHTANPPANPGGNSMTKAEIYKKDDHGRYIMSAPERQKALMENQIY